MPNSQYYTYLYILYVCYIAIVIIVGLDLVLTGFGYLCRWDWSLGLGILGVWLGVWLGWGLGGVVLGAAGGVLWRFGVVCFRLVYDI
jgi:hypothetical protein